MRSAHYAPYRFDERVPRCSCSTRPIKVFFVVNPGNPDSRAIRTETPGPAARPRADDRPDLLIVADTVYATFVEGFRSTLADLPRNVICLHSFSKNFGATGNRLGFVAVPTTRSLDELLAGAGRAPAGCNPQRVPLADVGRRALPFVARLVADSREVALHNIAGLATPDQVQMALFALAHLMPAAPRTAPRSAPSSPPATTPCWPRSASTRPAARMRTTTR